MPDQPVETALLADIERLRAEFPHTQELYREVCALLFFRYGTTPTANRLYQLVRKGSMSAPAEALSRFWAHLRENSRVDIAHPDLPEPLRAAAGELTATLWKAAQAAAQQSVIVFRDEAQTQVEQARFAEAASAAKRDQLADALLQTRAALDDAAQRNAQAQTDAAALAAAHTATQTALTNQLAQARSDAELAQQRADAAERAHTKTQQEQAQQARAQLHEAEQRHDAAIKHALQEIDRERMTTLGLRKAAEAEKEQAAQAAERSRSELAALHEQIAELRQQLGAQQGALHAMTAARDAAQQLAGQASAQRDEAVHRAVQAEQQASALQRESQQAFQATLQQALQTQWAHLLEEQTAQLIKAQAAPQFEPAGTVKPTRNR